MKVFACKRQGSYSGGLILVAAPTKEEAFNVFAHDERAHWMVDFHNAEGEWVDKDDDIAVFPIVTESNGYQHCGEEMFRVTSKRFYAK